MVIWILNLLKWSCLVYLRFCKNLAQNILIKILSWWNWSSFQYTGWALCKHCWQNRQKGAFVSSTAFLLQLLSDTHRHDVRKYKKIRWYTTLMTPAPLREAIKTSGQERRGESCCSQKFRTLGHFHFYTFSSNLLSCHTLLFLLKYVTKWKSEKGWGY